MRTLRLGALAALCLALGPAAGAIPPPTETDVRVRGLPGVKDGDGVLRLRSHVDGDPAQCPGTLRLKVVDRSEGEVVVDATKPMGEVRRFRVSLAPGRFRVVGSYELGEEDGCAESRHVTSLRVRE